MKKEYSKPNMEIVSFTTENLAVDNSAIVQAETQKTIKTIKYY